jgi:hypothetical protein
MISAKASNSRTSRLRIRVSTLLERDMLPKRRVGLGYYNYMQNPALLTTDGLQIR